jgi:hypothetical protein
MSRSGDVENRENVPGVSAVMVQFSSGEDIGIPGVVFLQEQPHLEVAMPGDGMLASFLWSTQKQIHP